MQSRSSAKRLRIARPPSSPEWPRLRVPLGHRRRAGNDHVRSRHQECQQAHESSGRSRPLGFGHSCFHGFTLLKIGRRPLIHQDGSVSSPRRRQSGRPRGQQQSGGLSYFDGYCATFEWVVLVPECAVAAWEWVRMERQDLRAYAQRAGHASPALFERPIQTPNVIVPSRRQPFIAHFQESAAPTARRADPRRTCCPS